MFHLSIDRLEVLKGSWENYLGFFPKTKKFSEFRGLVEGLAQEKQEKRAKKTIVTGEGQTLFLTLICEDFLYMGRITKNGEAFSPTEIAFLETA